MSDNLTADEFSAFLEMQRVIIECQSNNKPFFIVRLSGNEPNLCSIAFANAMPPRYLLQNMLLVAGIQFPSANCFHEYVKTYTESFKRCDMVGVWTGGSMLEQTRAFYNIIYQNPERAWRPFTATALEPYYSMHDERYAFDSIFKNKKVLILTSHSKTIKSQIPNLKNIFKKPVFHETTSFFVQKTPQQNGGSHDNRSWKLHFEELKTKVENIKNTFFDFDIALVSCGGFGMPISDYIRSDLGKSVIYVGGALQLFFGVMGSRWEKSERIQEHVNSYWVRPLEVDRPSNPEYCEQSCYW
jgi:hypothetical protein